MGESRIRAHSFVELKLMGACCGNDSEPVSKSIAQSKTSSTTQSIGLAGNDDEKTLNSEKKALHSRRNTSSKGITRLTMKFPHIRYSFKECKKVFVGNGDSERESVPLSEIKPLLISLGANESQLTEDEIARIVDIANLDGDDNIDFKEFLIAAAIGCFLKDVDNENKNMDDNFLKIRKGFLVAKEAFSYIDEDGSGEIDFDELKQAFSSMKYNDDLIEQRFKELDFDGDKNIEFPEFVWGITAWVGMDDDDALDIDNFEDEDVNTEANRVSIDNSTNYEP